MKKIISTVIMLVVLGVTGSVVAQESPDKKTPSCQEQLNDQTVLSHNVTTDRNQKEVALAKAHVMIMQLRQRNEQLEKQVVELTKKPESKP